MLYLLTFPEKHNIHNRHKYYYYFNVVKQVRKKLSRDTRLLLRLKIVLINLIFRIMYIVYMASWGDFRTCTSGYVVQQLSHSNYLKQRELTGRFIGVFIEAS
jgi:hypothetical protein